MNKKLQNISNKSANKDKQRLWSRNEKKGLLIAAVIVISGLLAYYGIPAVKEAKSQNSLNQQFDIELAANRICMVGNEIKFRENLPVNIGGKTYWACCNNCEAQLNRNYKNARFATDPYSGTKLSKAEAVIFQNPDDKGKVLFFESKSNYDNYIKQKKVQHDSEQN
ncbi:MAG TPA: TRASH domain-containing protein [Draconibacterium sp.]|nr:TRASH domain-containing protein [Draconibacterium sp.]